MHTIFFFNIKFIHNCDIGVSSLLYAILIRSPLGNSLRTDMDGEMAEVVFTVFALIETGPPFPIDGGNYTEVRINSCEQNGQLTHAYAFFPVRVIHVDVKIFLSVPPRHGSSTASSVIQDMP